METVLLKIIIGLFLDRVQFHALLYWEIIELIG